MLFMIQYRPKDGWTEAIAKRATRLFDNWKPPVGFNIKAHYARSDSEGGLVIVEAESPAAIMEATSTFALFYEHSVNPIVEISQAVPIVHRTRNGAIQSLKQLMRAAHRGASGALLAGFRGNLELAVNSVCFFFGSRY